MVLSTAKLNSMPKVTPTELSEATYQRTHAPKRMIDGPAGLPVPYPRAAYRMTQDPELLRRITTTALGEHQRRMMTDADREKLVAILLADVERRYPQADMVVLERYGFAKPREALFVATRGHKRMYRIDLPETVVLPAAAVEMVMPGVGRVADPVPDAALCFFDIIEQVDALRSDLLGVRPITDWPVRFKKNEGRPPIWAEIEAAFPLVGKWLAGQRKQMEMRR
jgi:hypothetical protein